MDNQEINFRVAEIIGETVWKENGFLWHENNDGEQVTWNPVEDWLQGGEIIERQRIDVISDYESGWWAYKNGCEAPADTPLKAAMLALIHEADKGR